MPQHLFSFAPDVGGCVTHTLASQPHAAAAALWAGGVSVEGCRCRNRITFLPACKAGGTAAISDFTSSVLLTEGIFLSWRT